MCQYGNGWPVPRSRSSRSSRSPSSRPARRHPPRRPARRKVGRRHRHRRPERQGRSTLSRYNGLKVAQRQLGVKGRVFISKCGGGLHPEPLAGCTQGYDLVDRRRLPDGRRDRRSREAVPEDASSRSSTTAPTFKGKPKNIRGILFARAGGRLPRRCRGSDDVAKKPHVIGAVGGVKIPPVDATSPGYQAGAKATKPGIRSLNGYSQSFTDQAKCKEIALNQIAPGLGGRLPGRRQLRPRRPLGGEGQGRLGHRRRHRPGVPRPVRAHERA